ncbi:sugar isomerase domain-containing protein [Salibacterium aidingense]|uniref:sugar isomerase domain-containing protein n=1 Tax=Salibacterium aidingense TaxID=384933 RepID=UPI003BCDC86E
MLAEQYQEKIIESIEMAFSNNKDVLKFLSGKIADSIEEDGLLHIFGCGHSHLLAEDIFYRAGGLLPINPILESNLMLHGGAVKSSSMERLEGYAAPILDNYKVKAGEVLIVISNSGINNVPVEMAMAAKEKGLYVAALSSSSYNKETSRHKSGKKLIDFADALIDNGIPHGDALLDVPGTDIRMAPGSTVIGSYLLNTLMVLVSERFIEKGTEPPILVSGNIKGGMERNKSLLDKYKECIKHL